GFVPDGFSSASRAARSSLLGRDGGTVTASSTSWRAGADAAIWVSAPLGGGGLGRDAGMRKPGFVCESFAPNAGSSAVVGGGRTGTGEGGGGSAGGGAVGGADRATR